MEEDKIILEMRGIVKDFPGIRALDNVDFDLYKGEVHCLVGENGAGKSTLIKVLVGVYSKERGEIFLEKKPVQISDPYEARLLGINAVHQELELIPSLSVAENIFLGNERRTRSGLIDWNNTAKEAEKLLDSLGIDLDVKRPVEELSVAQQELVAIAKAVCRESKVIIMDEPSAILSGKALELLFGVIQQLKEKNIGVIYISHHLGEIYEIGDRVTILKDGKVVKTEKVQNISLDEVIQHMIGRQLQDYYFKKEVTIGEPVLSVNNFQRGGILKGISFNLRKREILGIFGLIGAGRTELARAIIGADPRDQGELFLNGKKVEISSPKHALDMKIGYLSEDRKETGLLMRRSIGENISLPILRRFARFWGLDFSRLSEEIKNQVNKLKIKPSLLGQRVENLSGGNQQKVVLAKWLAARCNIIIMDEPTRGIDVGTKVEIYHLIAEMISQGISIILISSELPEILALSDRILIMNEGRVVKETVPEEISREEMLRLAIPRSLLERRTT